MFYLRYVFAELRRRKGRTILTALGLAVGVGLVVAVTALSSGLDEAQDEGAGAADRRRHRHVGHAPGDDRGALGRTADRDSGAGPGGGGLSASEQRAAREGERRRRARPRRAGRAGREVHDDQFVDDRAELPRAAGRQGRRRSTASSRSAARSRSTSCTISGTVPEESDGLTMQARAGPGRRRPGGLRAELRPVVGDRHRRLRAPTSARSPPTQMSRRPLLQRGRQRRGDDLAGLREQRGRRGRRHDQGRQEALRRRRHRRGRRSAASPPTSTCRSTTLQKMSDREGRDQRAPGPRRLGRAWSTRPRPRSRRSSRART